MPRISIEVFSATGKFNGRVSRLTASKMVAEGTAQWVDQGWGRRCLRRTAETHSRKAALGIRDTMANAGIGASEEILAARKRVIAWSPKEATT